VAALIAPACRRISIAAVSRLGNRFHDPAAAYFTPVLYDIFHLLALSAGMIKELQNLTESEHRAVN
jgi:hypothetical protein